MQNFRRLRVWQLAARMTLDAVESFSPRACRRLPGFRSQALRAVQSIEDNIAEGCGKSSPADMRKSIDQSVGSLSEFESQLERSHAIGIVSPRDYNKLKSRSVLVHKMLVRLRKRIGSDNPRRSDTHRLSG